MPKEILPTPSAPAPAGPYSPAVEAHGFVFLAGQVALLPDGGRAPDDIESETRQALENIGLILSDVGLGYSDVVKTTVFLADIADSPKVNEVYASYFGDSLPARSAFQVAELPAGFRIEIEAVAARPDMEER